MIGFMDKFLSRFNIAKKVLIITISVLLLSCLMNFYSYYYAISLGHAIEKVKEDNATLRDIQKITSWMAGITEKIVLLTIIPDDELNKDSILSTFSKIKKSEYAKKNDLDTAEKQILSAIDTIREVNALIGRGEVIKAEETINTKWKPAVKQIESILDNIGQRSLSKTAQGMDNIQASNKEMAVTLLVSLAIIFFIGAVMSLSLAGSLSKSIHQVTSILERMATGNMEGIDISRHSNDEIGVMIESLSRLVKVLDERNKLAKAITEGDLTRRVELASDKDYLGKSLKGMTEGLHKMISEIQTTSDLVASGSSQMAGLGSTLSDGVSRQASTMEDVSNFMLSIASQIKTNTETIKNVYKVANETHNNAQTALEKMRAMMDAISAIKNSSSEIRKIIQLIDGIAFQTNLLALNASVEAARAGQQGKGFSVVAEEVRSLSGRSSKAANDISEKIQGTINKVDYGVGIAEETMKALQSMTSQVSEVEKGIKEVLTASSHQETSVTQVNDGLKQIEDVTLANAQNAEKASEAAQYLACQAEKLIHELSRFRVSA
ncbi:MAG: methyl-accepting chemotaxis protein [Oligoflexales bacterium]|nr:methyl-accepting chemotaxis protein [Oligoflexales bacterium]